MSLFLQNSGIIIHSYLCVLQELFNFLLILNDRIHGLTYICVPVYVIIVLWFEARSKAIAWADIKTLIFLPLPPGC